MNAFRKSVKYLFLVYFLTNSLVFFGQEISLRKDDDGSWCLKMAEHNQAVWARSGNSMESLGHSNQNWGHKHQGHEVHICVDHHKFLHSLKTPGLPGEDNIKFFSLSLFNKSNIPPDCIRLTSLTFQGHDPGLVPCQAASSSILLL
jgi:hypothetical protein